MNVSGAQVRDPSPEERPFAGGAALSIRVASLLALAVVLEGLYMRITTLPAASYESPVLTLAFARRLVAGDAASIVTIAALAAGTGLAIVRRSTGPKWTAFEHGARLRVLALLATTVLAWVYATSAFNYYHDLAHGLDRILLVALVPLVWWRPMGIIAFLAVLLTFIGQFAHPIGGFSWAAPILLVRILLFTVAFCLLRSVTKRVRTADLIFLICCLVAAHYWVSGVAKVRLGWIADDQVILLLPATHASGWLAFLDPATVGNVTASLGRFNGPMKAVTILLELGAVLSLTHRRVLGSLLIGWIGLHVAIFAFSGILFWEWMLLDATLLRVLFARGAPAWPVFTRAHAALSIVLIGLGAIWFRPVELAWLSSPVNYAIRIHGVGESGREYDLHPRFFEPYAYQFTLADFRYLDPHAALPVTWGATRDRTVLAALRAARSREDVLAVEDDLGAIAFDATRSAAFDAFIRRFVGAWNEAGEEGHWWDLLAPPPKLWTWRRGEAPDPADPLTRVVIEQVTSWFDGAAYREIRSRTVREIDLAN